MKAEIVIDRVRLELKDDIEPYFWSNKELLGFIDEAQLEFTREVPIRDSRTPEICTLTYKAGAVEIPYHESIKRIRTAIREDSNGVLHKITLATLENRASLNSVSRPDYGVTIDGTRELTRPTDLFELFVDYDEDYIRFSSPSSTAGTIRLSVERLAWKEITECADELELRREYLPALIAWACYRAWNVQDAETFDPKASDRQYVSFVNHVSRAKTEYTRRHSQAGVVKCNW